jgi:hypothetical protein
MKPLPLSSHALFRESVHARARAPAPGQTESEQSDADALNVTLNNDLSALLRSPSYVGPERPEAVSRDRSLCLPTFSHLFDCQ